MFTQIWKCENCLEEHETFKMPNLRECRECGLSGCDSCVESKICKSCNKELCIDCFGDGNKCKNCIEEEDGPDDLKEN